MNTTAPQQSEYPSSFCWLHWLLAVSTPVLVLTGFSLHAVARPEWSLFSGVLPSWFWPGRVDLWHLVAAVVFSPAVIAMLWICRRGKFWRRASLVVLLVGGLLTVVTGIVLMNSLGSFTVRTWALWIHAALGLVLVPIALFWHTIIGVTSNWRKLTPTFHPWANPRWLPVLAFVPVALVTTCLVLSDLPCHPPWRNLVAQRIPAVDAGAADLASLPWNEATPLNIHLAGGAGFDAGQTRVTLRALHDGEHLFVMAEWLDADENRRYLPWRKTPDGWGHMRSGPIGGPQFDECRYYEDKFSLIFPTVPDWRFDRVGCAAYCHAGGGRAYGYKGSNRLVDVWHWKATRTDPVGQADDKYWDKVDFEAKDVGRHGDPKRGGGYEKNVSEDETHPAFLPDDLAAVHGGIIPTTHAVAYTEAAAKELPEDTVVPGIVASAFVGDRGHIACKSRHHSGRWTVWMRRKLDTGSRYDATFTPGGSHPFGCAAFNCTSKRHAYNLLPYRLVLAE